MRKRDRRRMIDDFIGGACVSDLMEIYKITRYQAETILRRYIIEIQFSDFDGELEDDDTVKSSEKAQSIL